MQKLEIHKNPMSIHVNVAHHMVPLRRFKLPNGSQLQTPGKKLRAAHHRSIFPRKKKEVFAGPAVGIDSNLQAGQTRRYAIKYSGYIRIPLKEMNSRKRRTAAPRFTTSVWYEKVGEAPGQRSTVGGPNIRRAQIGVTLGKAE